MRETQPLLQCLPGLELHHHMYKLLCLLSWRPILPQKLELQKKFLYEAIAFIFVSFYSLASLVWDILDMAYGITSLVRIGYFLQSSIIWMEN